METKALALAGGAGAAPRQVRADAPEVPEGASSHSLEPDDLGGDPVPAPAGDQLHGAAARPAVGEVVAPPRAGDTEHVAVARNGDAGPHRCRREFWLWFIERTGTECFKSSWN